MCDISMSNPSEEDRAYRVFIHVCECTSDQECQFNQEEKDRCQESGRRIVVINLPVPSADVLQAISEGVAGLPEDFQQPQDPLEDLLCSEEEPESPSGSLSE